MVMGLGLHGGGVGTIKFLAERGAEITVTDLRREEELQPSLEQLRDYEKIKYTLGRHDLRDFLEADLVVKGPGVKPDSEFLAAARAKNIPISNDIGIFLKECPAKIIGITGTRGKSTTAHLLAEFLRIKFPRVHLAGNIRQSVLEILPKINKEDWVVLELSSFQLQDLADSRLQLSGKPEIAVLTNIFPDHLNWHKNFAEYLAAKEIIFSFQSPENHLFINPEDKILCEMAQRAKAKVSQPILPTTWRKLVREKIGDHYFSSVALAAGVASFLGVSGSDMEKTLENFRGLKGRQEIVNQARGVTFVNDTTSTMPEATIAAVNRFRKKAGEKKLILIAGGQDKGLDYGKLAEEIKIKVDLLVLLPGTATEKILKELETLGCSNIEKAESMEEAVRKSKEATWAGDYVVLSPGAASFGLFLNEFDRGEKFIQEIEK